MWNGSAGPSQAQPKQCRLGQLSSEAGILGRGGLTLLKEWGGGQVLRGTPGDGGATEEGAKVCLVRKGSYDGRGEQ